MGGIGEERNAIDYLIDDKSLIRRLQNITFNGGFCFCIVIVVNLNSSAEKIPFKS